jgi:spore coat protein CotH
MSFIDYQLSMELGHNIDGYRKSCKLYKRRDHVDGRFKTVVWDMNLAYGNCNLREAWRTDGWIYQSNDLFHAAGEDFLIPFWWTRLNSDENYQRLLRERWTQYRNSSLTQEHVMAIIDSLAAELTSQDAIGRNSLAWPRWGVQVWPNYYVSKDFDDEVSHLKQWILERIAWMDEALGYRR